MPSCNDSFTFDSYWKIRGVSPSLASLQLFLFNPGQGIGNILHAHGLGNIAIHPCLTAGALIGSE